MTDSNLVGERSDTTGQQETPTEKRARRIMDVIGIGGHSDVATIRRIIEQELHLYRSQDVLSGDTGPFLCLECERATQHPSPRISL